MLFFAVQHRQVCRFQEGKQLPQALLLLPLLFCFHGIFWVLVPLLERLLLLQLPPRFPTLQAELSLFVCHSYTPISRLKIQNPLLAPCDPSPHLLARFHLYPRRTGWLVGQWLSWQLPLSCPAQLLNCLLPLTAPLRLLRHCLVLAIKWKI